MHLAFCVLINNLFDNVVFCFVLIVYVLDLLVFKLLFAIYFIVVASAFNLIHLTAANHHWLCREYNMRKVILLGIFCRKNVLRNCVM